jgi:hypothetical protein
MRFFGSARRGKRYCEPNAVGIRVERLQRELFLVQGFGLPPSAVKPDGRFTPGNNQQLSFEADGSGNVLVRQRSAYVMMIVERIRSNGYIDSAADASRLVISRSTPDGLPGSLQLLTPITCANIPPANTSSKELRAIERMLAESRTRSPDDSPRPKDAPSEKILLLGGVKRFIGPTV